jgi:hypothetical protein
MGSRKRWMRQPLSWKRGGAVALIVLILVAGAALVLDARAGGEYGPIVERLEAGGLEPVELVVETARASRIVVLGDIHGRAAPKRVVAEAIERLAAGPGLDAVVLDVPESEQRYIDAYLAAREDAAATLLSRPAAVHEAYGDAREYVRIYQAVRAANEGRSASERVRVIAADVEAWPPADGAARRDMGRLYASRAEHMLNRIDREIFTVLPEARVLVFVDGFMAMQGTHGEIRVGGGEGIRVEWLGELLRRRSGANARTILMDAGASAGGIQQMPNYRGTTLHRALRREVEGPRGARVTGELGAVEDAVVELSSPGLRLDILPEGYPLSAAAQGYIFFPGGR